MSKLYKGKIKVICIDKTCFPVDPKTLEATSCGTYDPYARTVPDLDAVETIDYCEWLRRNQTMKKNIEWEF